MIPDYVKSVSLTSVTSYICSMLVHTQEDILMFDNSRPK